MQRMSFRDKLAAVLTPATATPGPARAAYDAAVAHARREDWFASAQVPDSIDGRFDVLALVLALLVIRSQAEGDGAFEAALIDRFAEDMDASFREMGVGDLSISKAVGQAVGALGGRIGGYRAALADGGAGLDSALVRNLYRGTEPTGPALATAVVLVRDAAAAITAADWRQVTEGRW